MNITLRPISLAVITLVASIAIAAHAQETRRSYIVQLPAAAASSYEGGIPGLPATKPAPGNHLDVSATDVQNYIAYLTQKQNDVLATINPANVTARYDVALNGFAAMLTDTEVRALKKNAGVLSIQADEVHQLYTSTTPTFLGLDQPNGLWNKVGGKSNAGEGMIIAMLDSGVWPENTSFADRVDANGVPTQDPSGTQVYGPPPAKWRNYPHTGADDLPNGCETTKAGIKASDCNNKLIGIRSFIAPTASSPIVANDFLSGRDGTLEGGGGHGSHTLSTAGGNAGVPVTINGIDLGFLSGMAPRARLAMYKVCYSTTANASTCQSSATVSAVNQAIKDGVDVINYSIGPTAGGGNMSDPQEVAFLNASNAGIFVAAAAGNAGPVTGPAANLGPWHATVAASTHNRTVGANVVEGDGVIYRGTSLNAAPLPSAALIDARNAGTVAYDALTPQDQMARRLCYTAVDRATPGATTFPGLPAGTTASSMGALDPALVADKIVICDRGNNARVSKSAAVLEATGAGMVLVDNGGGLVSEAHSVPTVHITQADGALLKAYTAATAAPTAALTKAMVFLDTPAPYIANFSSRGPNVSDNGMLKPDIAAPGVDIAASFAPSTTAAEVASLKAGGSTTKTGASIISGTSMASPHIAGLAALVKQAHPTWSVAAIKSALMTSAGDTLEDGVTTPLPWTAGATAAGATPFGQGAGQVAPNGAVDPGLVYDAGQLDYVKLSCGFTAPNVQLYTAATCNFYGQIKGTALNLPSITAGAIPGVQTISRTVTSVGDVSATYHATVAMNGFSAVVTPASFTIAPGQTQTYSVKLTRTSAPLDTWAFGTLTWEDDNGHKVRSPISARGNASVAAPALVYSEAASGSKTITIGTGFSGPMTVDKGGLKTATRTSFSFAATSTATQLTLCRNNNSPAVKATNFVVPAGTMVARFSLYNADTGAAATQDAVDDLDLVVLNGTTQVGASGNEGSNESVTLMNPAAGTYKVCVIAYDKQTRPTTTATLSSWIVSTADVGGNFKVLAPATAYIGGTASVGMSWSGLAANQRFLGAVNYRANGVLSGSTLVDVQTNDPVPLAKSSKALVPAAD